MRKATVELPMKVALQYSHKLPKTPDGRAGASDVAGFIDAPEMNARKNIQNGG